MKEGRSREATDGLGRKGRTWMGRNEAGVGLYGKIERALGIEGWGKCGMKRGKAGWKGHQSVLDMEKWKASVGKA